MQMALGQAANLGLFMRAGGISQPITIIVIDQCEEGIHLHSYTTVHIHTVCVNMRIFGSHCTSAHLCIEIFPRPAQLLDLRAWSLRKLPLMPGIQGPIAVLLFAIFGILHDGCDLGQGHGLVTLPDIISWYIYISQNPGFASWVWSNFSDVHLQFTILTISENETMLVSFRI